MKQCFCLEIKLWGAIFKVERLAFFNPVMNYEKNNNNKKKRKKNSNLNLVVLS